VVEVHVVRRREGRHAGPQSLVPAAEALRDGTADREEDAEADRAGNGPAPAPGDGPLHGKDRDRKVVPVRSARGRHVAAHPVGLGVGRDLRLECGYAAFLRDAIVVDERDPLAARRRKREVAGT
jgi:hypothetical protein